MEDNEEQKQEEQPTDWGSFLEGLQNEENPIPEAAPVEPTPEAAPVEPTPTPMPSVSPEFLGAFSGTYNRGIDAGYTPYGEGLGDNARYGDASKNWTVGQDPASILVPAFSGQGGLMGEGIRGAFSLIKQEFGKQGKEQIKPEEFVKQAREGTLTRVFPQEDPTSGDVYRIYQYGDEKYGAPRYTKEKVYEAPKAPAARSSGGTRPPGPPPPPPGPQGPTRDADTQAAQTKMSVPPGWTSSGAYKNQDGSIQTVLSNGTENRQFTYNPASQRWEQTWPPAPGADLAGLNQAPRTAGGPPPPPPPPGVGVNGTPYTGQPSNVGQGVNPYTGQVPGVGVNGTPYTGPVPQAGASGEFIPSQPYGPGNQYAPPPPQSGWRPAYGNDWNGAMYHPEYGVLSQSEYRALVSPAPVATGTPVPPASGTVVPPPVNTPVPSGTPTPAWRPADGSNPNGMMFNIYTGEVVSQAEYRQRIQGR